MIRFRICQDPHNQRYYIEKNSGDVWNDLWHRFDYREFDTPETAGAYINKELKRPIIIKEFTYNG